MRSPPALRESQNCTCSVKSPSFQAYWYRACGPVSCSAGPNAARKSLSVLPIPPGGAIWRSPPRVMTAGIGVGVMVGVGGIGVGVGVTVGGAGVAVAAGVSVTVGLGAGVGGGGVVGV